MRAFVLLVVSVALFERASAFSPSGFSSRRSLPTKFFASEGVDDGGIFTPLRKAFSGILDQVTTTATDAPPAFLEDAAIDECKVVLNAAVETKSKDPELVVSSLESLEKLMRKKCRAEPEAVSELLTALDGDWRLVFTTGTADTQKKIGAKVNYFPIKAMQSFRTAAEPMEIENGIYLGDFAVIKFFGDFEFNPKSRKVEFDFDRIAVLGLTINLGKGDAAALGAASGLGSENNVKLVEKKKKPFFNWISADDTIATARGGGGGLALWKRV